MILSLYVGYIATEVSNQIWKVSRNGNLLPTIASKTSPTVIATQVWRLSSIRSVRMASSTSALPANVVAQSHGDVAAPQPAPLTMQIVVRRDLLEVSSNFKCLACELIESLQAEGWGVGPLMAQVAHATAAVRLFVLLILKLRADTHTQVLHETKDAADTLAYMDDLKNMRKVKLAHVRAVKLSIDAVFI